jgi:hypothetical protein
MLVYLINAITVILALLASYIAFRSVRQQHQLRQNLEEITSLGSTYLDKIGELENLANELADSDTSSAFLRENLRGTLSEQEEERLY